MNTLKIIRNKSTSFLGYHTKKGYICKPIIQQIRAASVCIDIGIVINSKSKDMRIVIQRVKQASVTINDKIGSEIGSGYLILLGIEEADHQEDADWLVKKVVGLRVFNDENGVMNLNIIDTHGEALVVSQFTLFASYKKGNRPSWYRAARHEISIPLYEYFCSRLEQEMHKPIGKGVFGADMKVALLNDGPVTIIMDSKSRE